MVITALVSGLLLLLVPRYILPACEYLGHPAMHCSDTARAEYVVGTLFVVLGGVTAFLRSRKVDLICAAGSIVLSAAAFLLPDKFGYCRSTQMPCNYGMVPGVRFIAIVSAIIMCIALIGTVKSYRKKGSS
jgi:hypothetical protein